MSARRAAFLDRDGVINYDRGYVHRPEQFEFVPGVFEAVRELRRLAFVPVVVTNQSGIGREIYSASDFDSLTSWMTQRFASEGAPIGAVYYCPHHPSDALNSYRIACDCRKPAPGMLFAAARDLNLDLARSAMFGDRISDIEAAQAAGIEHCFLLGTDGALTAGAAHLASALSSATYPDLLAAVSSPSFQQFAQESVKKESI